MSVADLLAVGDTITARGWLSADHDGSGAEAVLYEPILGELSLPLRGAAIAESDCTHVQVRGTWDGAALQVEAVAEVPAKLVAREGHIELSKALRKIVPTPVRGESEDALWKPALCQRIQTLQGDGLVLSVTRLTIAPGQPVVALSSPSPEAVRQQLSALAPDTQLVVLPSRWDSHALDSARARAGAIPHNRILATEEATNAHGEVTVRVRTAVTDSDVLAAQRDLPDGLLEATAWLNLAAS